MHMEVHADHNNPNSPEIKIPRIEKYLDICRDTVKVKLYHYTCRYEAIRI